MSRENGYVKARERKALDEARRFMNRVVDYVYRQGQDDDTLDQRQLTTLTLRLLRAVRQDEPQPWVAACFYTFGSTLEAYQEHRNQVQWRKYHEFIDAIPKPAAHPVAPQVVPWPDTGTSDREDRLPTPTRIEVGNRKDANLADAVSAG